MSADPRGLRWLLRARRFARWGSGTPRWLARSWQSRVARVAYQIGTDVVGLNPSQQPPLAACPPSWGHGRTVGRQVQHNSGGILVHSKNLRAGRRPSRLRRSAGVGRPRRGGMTRTAWVEMGHW